MRRLVRSSVAQLLCVFPFSPSSPFPLPPSPSVPVVSVTFRSRCLRRPPFPFSRDLRCGISRDVENLWTIGAFPVDSATPKFFFDGSRWKTSARLHVHAVSSAASLDIRRRLHRMTCRTGNSLSLPYRDCCCPSFRRIHCGTRLSDRSQFRGERPLARVHRARAGRADGPDAVLWPHADGSRATAERLADARARRS